MDSKHVLLALAAVAQCAMAQTLLVLNKEDATLAIVDVASKTVVGRVPTGEAPHEMTTDGKLAFVANYGSRTPGSTLSVIDIAARKEIRRVDLGPLRRPHGIAYADGKVYFTAEVNRVVSRYDPVAGQVDWLLGTGQVATHMVLVTKDAGTLFTANIGSDSITMIERVAGPAGWTETVIPVGKGPEGNDLSPDGKELWVANSRDGSVSIINVAEKKVVGSIALGTKRSNRLKFTPDGKRALVTDLDAGELIVLDTVARKETQRVKLGRTPEGILIPPDGSVAYVGVAGDNFIAIVDLKTLEVTGRIETGKGPDGMAWVPAK